MGKLDWELTLKHCLKILSKTRGKTVRDRYNISMVYNLIKHLLEYVNETGQKAQDGLRNL